MSRLPTLITPELQERYTPVGRIVALVGCVVSIAAPFLPWAWSGDALDNMTIAGYPSPLQMIALVLAAIIGGLLIASWLIKPDRLPWRIGWIRGAKAGSFWLLLYIALILVSIAVELGGLVNVVYGGWIALVGAVLVFGGTRFLVPERQPTLASAVAKPWIEILAIVALMAVALFGTAFALNHDDGGSFVSFLAAAGGFIAILFRTGVMSWLTGVSERHRKVLILAAFVVAFLFPFTQNGSDANMSIATQILIFAATAMGLNMVVGLAGLLDLGYVAFLGAGAFTAAVLSRSAFSTVNFHPPFIVVVLISGCVAATLGLLIGSPTLRVSGDYLAIVTLAFGEIFRITMNNLDGNDGPNLTNGSNGIPAIPDLSILGFDFGKPHVVFGITLGRFSNYFFLLLFLLALVILVFVRLNASRIGRGWVAIREDERAAEAMGVNVFGLKLFAFAGGAFLAGVAGSVKAHVDVSVTPDQYVFLTSAFLLAAIVLGGMGTVLGVLVGSVLLNLLPEKLRFFADYRLLLFGLLLIIMMRFRPEGLVANQRRQLEFHEEDEELVERVQEELDETGEMREATR